MTLAISIREGDDEDTHFILDSWLNDFRTYGHGMKHVRTDAFFAHHRPIVERTLARHGSGLRIAVATPLEASETILGYLVCSPSTAHYVYVKGPFRRFGIATRLLESLHPECKQYSYRTDTTAAINLIGKLKHLSYNPYAEELNHARSPEAEHQRRVEPSNPRESVPTQGRRQSY